MKSYWQCYRRRKCPSLAVLSTRIKDQDCTLHNMKYQEVNDTDERLKCVKTPLAKLIQKVTGPAFDADSV